MKSCWLRSLRTNAMRLRPLFLFAFLLIPLGRPALAQDRGSALSEGEVEKLRENAPLYVERVQLFTGFLDDRTKAVIALTNGKRHAGREQDIHDLMEQFTSIADDLEDNLEDYSRRHRDVRKALPKLLAATERWQSALKTPPDNPAYDVSRKLALEAVTDLRDDTVKMIEEQKAYFIAHPPDKPGQAKPEGGPSN